MLAKDFSHMQLLAFLRDTEHEHGSLNVPIEHHPTIRYMVNAMATIR